MAYMIKYYRLNHVQKDFVDKVINYSGNIKKKVLWVG